MEVHNNLGWGRTPDMVTMKKAPFLIAGGVVGIITVRALQKRRSNQSEDEQRVEEERGPETPTEHAKAAVEHTREAARKTKESPPRLAK